jgi:hypothetical protein
MNKEEEAMRQTLWSVFLVALISAVTVGLVAQAPSSSAPQASKVTFSGCIEKAPSESGVSPAAPAEAAAGAKFILSNASPAGTGAVGTAGGAKPAAKYRLDADDAKISPHVGHKVEVTGTVEEQPPAASSPSSAAASSMAAPKLKVDSVKMVAAACP